MDMPASVIPRFFIGYRLTERRGHTIRRIEERVQLILAGNNMTSPAMKVTQEHIDRWPEQYKAFRRRQKLSTLFRLWLADRIDGIKRAISYSRAVIDPDRAMAMDILYQSDWVSATRTREKIQQEQQSEIRRELEAALNKEAE